MTITDQGDDWFLMTFTFTSSVTIGNVVGAIYLGSPGAYAGASESFDIFAPQFKSTAADSVYLANSQAFPQFRGINGRAAVRFDGAASYMTSAATLANIFAAGAKTSFIVMRPALIDSFQTIFTDSADKFYAQVGNVGGRVQITNDDGSAVTRSVTGAVVGATGVWRILHDTNLVIGRNDVWGVALASGATTPMTGTLLMGSYSGSQWLNADIAELLTFNKVLPSDVRDRIQRGLCKKWGADC
jgi:hypothetical protein